MQETNPQNEKDVEAISSASIQRSERDSNLVDWDSVDDPENPMNWPLWKKSLNVGVISFITFLSPLASTIFAPGVQDAMAEFQSTNTTLASFVVSIYLMGYSFGPLIIAPLSETYGRMPVYNVCNLLFLIFSIACAVAPNLASLTVFRLLAGFAGCCPVTIGAGSIADIIHREKRGAAMSAWVMGPLFGPVVGPLAGGYLTQAKGWRWLFWLLSIASGAVVIVTLLFVRESYAPVLLERKAKQLRKETGNDKLRSVLDTGRTARENFKLAIVRPTKMLFLSPIVLLVALGVAIIYGYLYLLFTTIPQVFEEQYHFSQGSVGLAYLGLGIGSLLSLLIMGVTSDRLVRYLTTKNGGEPKPEYRLPPLIIGYLFIPVGLFWYGWSAQAKTHWIVPILGTAVLGLGMIACFMTSVTYLVDAFTTYAASAIAANTVLRSLLGALLPLAGPKMYQALGLGWGNSLLGFIGISLFPLALMFFKYGERIRQSKRFQLEL